jgi:hypothetical protein
LSSTGTATDWVSKSDLGLVDGSGTANFVSKWSDTDTLTNSLIFDNGTNVGIGNTSPAAKLDVTGTLAVSGNAAFDTNTLFVDAATNRVGVLTTSPTEPLHVEGNISLAYGSSLKAANATYTTLLETGYNGSSDFVSLYTAGNNAGNATAKITMLANGNVGIGTTSPASKLDVNGDIATSGDIILTGAKGIYFDSGGSKYLDDYEVGTWTMGVSFDGASVGVTTSSNTGTYTKVGRQVTVNGYLVLTSKGSSTGAARITGLPFTIANTTGNYSALSLRFSSITFANQFQGYGVVNATTIDLEEVTILGTVTSLTNADFANNSTIILSLTYFV